SYARFFEELCRGSRSPATGRLLLRTGRFSVASQSTHALSLKGLSATLCAGITAGLHGLIYGFEVLRRSATQDALVVIAADEVGGLFFRLIDCLDILAMDRGRGGEVLTPYDP